MGNTCKHDVPQAQFTKASNPQTFKLGNGPESSFAQEISAFPDLSGEQKQTIETVGDHDYSSERRLDEDIEIQRIEKSYKLKNGWIYEGQWHKGMIWGQGRFHAPDQSVIHCYCRKNQPISKVLLVKKNGDYYKGEVKNFKAQGEGVLRQKNATFKGNFANNVLNGEATEEGQNYIFEGFFDAGRKIRGKLSWNIGRENETVYEGRFYEGKFDGKGRISNEKGVYDGFFKNGNKNGTGTFKWKNGAFFQGEYLNDKKNGGGKMFNPNGNLIIEGIWKNDQLVQEPSTAPIN